MESGNRAKGGHFKSNRKLIGKPVRSGAQSRVMLRTKRPVGLSNSGKDSELRDCRVPHLLLIALEAVRSLCPILSLPLNLLKNKIQFKVQISIIQQFLSWATSLLADRKAPQGAVQNGRGFHRQKGEKTELLQAKSPSFREQKGSIKCITSPALTRKFQTDWLRLHSWERLKLQLG